MNRMTTQVSVPDLKKKSVLGLTGRRRLLQGFALAVMVIYSLLTIFPF